MSCDDGNKDGAAAIDGVMRPQQRICGGSGDGKKSGIQLQNDAFLLRADVGEDPLDRITGLNRGRDGRIKRIVEKAGAREADPIGCKDNLRSRQRHIFVENHTPLVADPCRCRQV